MNQLSKRKVVIWCINVLISLIPISLLFSPFLNSLVIASLTFYSFILFYFKNKNSLILPKINKFILYPYFIFISFHFISLTYSSDILQGVSLLTRRTPLLLIPFIFYVNYEHLNTKVMLYTFLYGVFIVSVFTFFNACYSIYLNNESIDTFLNNYVRYFYVSFMPYQMHPTYFGLLLCTSLAVSFNFIFKKESILVQTFFCLFFLFNIYMISSQMTTFICLIVILLYFLRNLKKIYNTLIYNILVSVIALVFISLILKGEYITTTIVKTFKIDNTSNLFFRASHFFTQGDITRKKNWGSACKVIESNFFLGVGLGDGVSEMQKHREKNTWIYKTKLNAHNQYFEELIHFGVIGFSAFIFVLGGIFYLSKDNLFCLSLFLIIFCGMITESILNRQVGITLFTFSLSFIVFGKNKNLNLDRSTKK